MFKLKLPKLFKKIPKFPAPTNPIPGSYGHRAHHPGMGYCGRCGMPWALVQPHSVMVTKTEDSSSGRFPCCEKCWSNMSLHDRLYHMERLCDLDDAWSKYHGEKPDPNNRNSHRSAVVHEWWKNELKKQQTKESIFVQQKVHEYKQKVRYAVQESPAYSEEIY